MLRCHRGRSAGGHPPDEPLREERRQRLCQQGGRSGPAGPPVPVQGRMAEVHRHLQRGPGRRSAQPPGVGSHHPVFHRPVLQGGSLVRGHHRQRHHQHAAQGQSGQHVRFARRYPGHRLGRALRGRPAARPDGTFPAGQALQGPGPSAQFAARPDGHLGRPGRCEPLPYPVHRAA